MTNKEAIEELKGLQEFINGTRLNGEIRVEAFDLAIKALAERPQGEWIKKFNEVSYWYECDQCGERPARNYLGDDYLSRFCPNCGSQMQKGGAE